MDHVHAVVDADADDHGGDEHVEEVHRQARAATMPPSIQITPTKSGNSEATVSNTRRKSIQRMASTSAKPISDAMMASRRTVAAHVLAHHVDAGELGLGPELGGEPAQPGRRLALPALRRRVEVDDRGPAVRRLPHEPLEQALAGVVDPQVVERDRLRRPTPPARTDRGRARTPRAAAPRAPPPRGRRGAPARREARSPRLRSSQAMVSSWRSRGGSTETMLSARTSSGPPASARAFSVAVAVSSSTSSSESPRSTSIMKSRPVPKCSRHQPLDVRRCGCRAGASRGSSPRT